LAALFAVDHGEVEGGQRLYRERASLTMTDARIAHRRKPHVSFFARSRYQTDARSCIEPPHPTRIMIYHYQLAMRAFSRLKGCSMETIQALDHESIESESSTIPKFGTKLLVPARSDLSTDTGEFSINRLTIFISLSSVISLVHLGAWNYHFPTATEKWMWRASGLVMAPAALCFLLSQALTKVGNRMSEWIQNREQQQKHKGSRWVSIKNRMVAALKGTLRCIVLFSWLISWLLVAVSLCARLFTVGETFASLRAPPIGTYDTVSWTGIIPHIE
jgi:hypothetical protein